MSAVYCGSKRYYFEDIPSPPSSKRFRCYSPSNSPTWSSPSSSLDQLRTAFPHLELTVVVKALEEHESDLNAAKSPNGVLEARCLSYKSDEITIGSCTKSSFLLLSGSCLLALSLLHIIAANGEYATKPMDHHHTIHSKSCFLFAATNMFVECF